MESRYLYRGKRIDNGKWVEGFYFCMTHTDGRHTHHFIIPLGADLSLGTPVEKIQVEVDQSTICQCTGLKDKNGKLIWENDIVKINNSKVNVLITFRDFEIICTIPSEKYYKHRLEYDTEYEVVGNMIDNPELLEVQP